MELDLHLKINEVDFDIVKRPSLYTPSPLSQELDYGGVSIPNGLAKARVKKNRSKRFNKQVAPGVIQDIVSTPSGQQTFVNGVSAPRKSVSTPSKYYPNPTVDEPMVSKPAPLAINEPPAPPAPPSAPKPPAPIQSNQPARNPVNFVDELKQRMNAGRVKRVE